MQAELADGVGELAGADAHPDGHTRLQAVVLQPLLNRLAVGPEERRIRGDLQRLLLDLAPSVSVLPCIWPRV